MTNRRSFLAAIAAVFTGLFGVKAKRVGPFVPNVITKFKPRTISAENWVAYMDDGHLFYWKESAQDLSLLSGDRW